MADSWIADFHSGSEMFLPIRHFCEKLPECGWPSHETLNRLACHVTNSSGLPIRFVKSSGENYERRIHLEGEVHTREACWHDLFNALIWMRYPKAKSFLNLRHFEEMQKEDGRRGKMRDIATLFDESGVIVASSNPSLSNMLRRFEWKSLFIDHRKRVKDEMRFYIFGHGLYEKALSPFVGLTGHAVLFPVEKSLFSLPLDEQIENLDSSFEGIFSEIATPLDLCPLPLLGVPGWAIENEDPVYYDNESYFRRGRIRNCGKPGSAPLPK
jgi:hypothetical protein